MTASALTIALVATWILSGVALLSRLDAILSGWARMAGQHAHRVALPGGALRLAELSWLILPLGGRPVFLRSTPLALYLVPLGMRRLLTPLRVPWDQVEDIGQTGLLTDRRAFRTQPDGPVLEVSREAWERLVVNRAEPVARPVVTGHGPDSAMLVS